MPDMAPVADAVAEGVRLVESARGEGLEVYLLGGVAIRAVTPSPLFVRAYADIDLVITRASGRGIRPLLESLGYVADTEFNTIHGRTRMLFRDEVNARHLDVLIGEFEMCHVVPVLERARPGALTIPLAELLLTKLQIVEINEKDLLDVYTLLHGHAVVVGRSEERAIDQGRIAELCRADWGLWRTVTGSLARVGERPEEPVIDDGAWQVIADRRASIEAAIAGAPKSRKWRLRSRIGDRVQWYELPEEAH
jgi:hypothetical protein